MFAQDFSTLRKFIQEIVIGFSCEHPSILPMKGYYIEQAKPMGWNLYIKMPRMQGSLKDILDKHKKDNDPIPEKDIIRYFYSIACGLEYLHNKKIAHRDVKPANILFDKEGHVRLGDIGVGKFVPDDEALIYVSDVAGTELYRAPEMSAGGPKMLKKDVYKADSWSLGIVIGELCLLHRKERRPNQALEAYLKGQLAQIETKYSPKLASLLGDLLHADPLKRKSIEQIRKSLEENYGKLLGMESSNISAFNLDKVKNELQKQWRSVFELDTTKGFVVKGTDPNKINNNVMLDFMKDLEIKFRANDLENLQNLELNLECCSQITNEGLEQVAAYIGANLKKLNNLAINFAACYEIKDEGLAALGAQIGANLKSLEELSLDFGWCKKITDKGLKGFHDALGTNLQHLQYLTLHYRGCILITDEGVKAVATHIGSDLKHLNHLSLSFWNCNLIKDQGLREVSNRIVANMEKLYHLSLNFIGCYEITDEEIKSLALNITMNLKKLKHITLNLIGTGNNPDTKEDLKNALTELFSFIPQRNLSI